MPTSHSCIIVDDDEIDRLTTVSYIKKHTPFEIAGVYESAEEALEKTGKNLPHIAFFEVDMPGISGLELRKKLEAIPVCVFITSFPDYAVESFELAALDFLVKPIRADRFLKTVCRIEEYLTIKEKSALLGHTLGADTIFIKVGHEQIKLSLYEILYLEALKDFTSIVTEKGKYCVLSTLGNLLTQPGFQNFVRIHKSYAVQKHFVNRIAANQLQVKEINLPVGRTYKTALELLKQQ